MVEDFCAKSQHYISSPSSGCTSFTGHLRGQTLLMYSSIRWNFCSCAKEFFNAELCPSPLSLHNFELLLFQLLLRFMCGIQNQSLAVLSFASTCQWNGTRGSHRSAFLTFLFCPVRKHSTFERQVIVTRPLSFMLFFDLVNLTNGAVKQRRDQIFQFCSLLNRTIARCFVHHHEMHY